MLQLKKELNFLLWTADVPAVPEDFPLAVRNREKPELAKINIQCVSHMLVTMAIFMGRGYAVTTRAGMAFLLDASESGDADDDLLNQIGKHWWFSVDGFGLVDLSLSAESENPLIYCNRSVGGHWRVCFGESRQKLDAFLGLRKRGCFYLTSAKKNVSHADLAQSLSELFKPAKNRGFHIPYANIVRHCEKLLLGSTKSLAGMTQNEAWQNIVEQ